MRRVRTAAGVVDLCTTIHVQLSSLRKACCRAVTPICSSHYHLTSEPACHVQALGPPARGLFAHQTPPFSPGLRKQQGGKPTKGSTPQHGPEAPKVAQTQQVIWHSRVAALREGPKGSQVSALQQRLPPAADQVQHYTMLPVWHMSCTSSCLSHAC